MITKTCSRLLTTGLMAVFLVGCAGIKLPDRKPTTKPAPELAPEKRPAPKTTKQEKLRLQPISFAEMQGWNRFSGSSVTGAVQSFKKSCAKFLRQPADKSAGNISIAMQAGDWHQVCKKLNAINPTNTGALKSFFQQNFTPLRALPNNEKGGVFTGYYEAELFGSRKKTAKYKHPIYGMPKDLVSIDLGQFDDSLKGRTIVAQVKGNKATQYQTRGSLDKYGNKNAPVLYYVDDYIDLFVLHVQGSGRVVLDDKSVVRVGYAGNNGHTFGSIAGYLMRNGHIKSSQASWQGIRKWVDANPDKSAETFAANPRYIFFRNTGSDGPFGAQGVALTPRHSMAVDPKYIPLGMPLWLETTQPGMSKAPLNTLVIAQDTGNAIKGTVRGDFFWGYGAKALAKAGIMKSRGTYVLLLPNPTARRMGL